jgi:hypothetical protein
MTFKKQIQKIKHYINGPEIGKRLANFPIASEYSAMQASHQSWCFFRGRF